VNLAATPRTRPGTGAMVAIVATVTAVVAALHVWYGNRHNFFDLKIYVAAMRWWAGGHPLYEFVKPDDTQGQLGYTYPPFAALLMRPLAGLPMGVTIAAYVVVSVVCLALSAWWLVGPVADRHGWPRWFACGLAFVAMTALEPVREAFTFGQVNPILWVLILLDLVVLLPRGSRWVGVGIGLATAIKLVPAIFILYLLVSRRWRASAVATATAVGATLLAAALAWSESWTFWAHNLAAGEGVGQVAYEFNQSLRGTLARLGIPGQPVLWLILALIVLGYGMWRAREAALAGDEVAGLTLTGLVGSLISPVTWVQHIFWLVPALVVLVDTGRRTFAAVVYLTTTVSALSVWSFAFHKPGGPVGFAFGNWYVWLMLVLLVRLPVRRQVAVST
jgi:alpha-1,2-mannosyltransferase